MVVPSWIMTKTSSSPSGLPNLTHRRRGQSPRSSARKRAQAVPYAEGFVVVGNAAVADVDRLHAGFPLAAIGTPAAGAGGWPVHLSGTGEGGAGRPVALAFLFVVATGVGAAGAADPVGVLHRRAGVDMVGAAFPAAADLGAALTGALARPAGVAAAEVRRASAGPAERRGEHGVGAAGQAREPSPAGPPHRSESGSGYRSGPRPSGALLAAWARLCQVRPLRVPAPIRQWWPSPASST